MQQYYIMRPTGRGAPRTTLPVQLNKDLATSNYEPLKLPADLHSFRAQASRRGHWQRLTTEIINAYKTKYNLIQHRRRRPRPAIPRDQPSYPLLQGMIFVAGIFDSLDNPTQDRTPVLYKPSTT